MNIAEHLTENQLSDYFQDSLEKKRKHEIGRHLLQCDFCLKRMPSPTPEQFWAALMTENDVNEVNSDITNVSPRLGFVSELFTFPKVLTWSAGGLAIVLIFMVLMWFSVAIPSNEEKEVAQVFDTEIAELKQNETIEGNIPQKDLTSKPNDSTTSSEPNRAIVISKPENVDLQSRNRSLSTENNLSQQSKKIIPSKKLANISLTRGVTAKCSDEIPVEMDFVTGKESTVFRWSKVPNAVKYNFYISDDEEILIDEYETEQETSYVMKKSLDAAKSYKWKVIVTLENGNTTVGASQKFTVGDIQQNKKKKSEKKRKSEVRCAENK